jgi:hypothetical protein
MADISFDRPEQANPLANFISQYWRTAVVAVIAAVAAAGGYAWYTSSVKAAKQKAENELGAIIANQTGPERLANLEAYLKNAPSSTKGAALLEIARTAQDQREFAKAADAWNQLSITGPDGMRELAVMGHASALAQAGDKAKAVKILADFLPKAPKAFQALAARQLASIAEEAQAWSEAVAAYERLKEAAGNSNKAYFDAKLEELKAKTK